MAQFKTLEQMIVSPYLYVLDANPSPAGAGLLERVQRTFGNLRICH